MTSSPASPDLSSHRGWSIPQQPSPMRFDRYERRDRSDLRAASWRTWPDRRLEHAPVWASVDLRDGNQALPNPMDAGRKQAMFDLLVSIGFKDIEVGYPSSGEIDFDFVRRLIRDDRIPDDVTISVFTPAKPDLIDRTFESIAGCDRAVVHLCMATACLWRDVVFGLSRDELRRLTLDSTEQILRRADAMSGSNVRFEYSPETFNVTEPEFALEMANAVVERWDATTDRPVVINLPSTVETDTPNVYADQIEWMQRHLDRRSSIILSVHPHNDRGTAVASAEQSLLAGADRVEGTLFGNGERTGNVCLATLALNLFSHGVDPQLDFTDIDAVRRTVEMCNQAPVPQRYPYAGSLVYTAFSGTHQDAIAKGLAAHEARARANGRPVSEEPWSVPYLPIDPHDVGRTYASVVRVNSQSGKGGVAHILRAVHGLELPRPMRVDFSRVVQRHVDGTGREIDAAGLWDLFCDEYVVPGTEVLQPGGVRRSETGVTFAVLDGGVPVEMTGSGPDVPEAVVVALRDAGYAIDGHEIFTHLLPSGQTAAYATVARSGLPDVHGAGIAPNEADAVVAALLAGSRRGAVTRSPVRAEP